MSKVAIVFKIYPVAGRVDEVMSRIKDALKPAAMQADDVAFGIKVIKARFVFDDSEGTASSIEEQMKKIDGVSEVEVEEESLI
ncbi:MAG: hypothetical protein M1528_01200 [Candidatus Marsarchaeota archaeon]|jgi:translation elongation factor EF-1beta|nr:hypothetical protein [Candidatus Marsarchaeota archaeon]MCL5115134.1 hypothetical protein [Candidatus Marsarchaeota archaeon]